MRWLRSQCFGQDISRRQQWPNAQPTNCLILYVGRDDDGGDNDDGGGDDDDGDNDDENGDTLSLPKTGAEEEFRASTL